MADWYDRYQEFSKSEWAPTQLSEKDEGEFKKWLIKTRWFKQVKQRAALSGEKLSDEDLYTDLTGPRADYDYRGAWKAGVGPQEYEFDEESDHWASSSPDGKMLKSPKHPTVWMEYFMEDTGIDPNSLGLRNAEEARAYTERLKDYSAFKKGK
jgi:hypothetical protein